MISLSVFGSVEVGTAPCRSQGIGRETNNGHRSGSNGAETLILSHRHNVFIVKGLTSDSLRAPELANGIGIISSKFGTKRSEQ